ncbi:MAG: hypothetical protein MdMp014T_2942 [Treponematales bacterium]
MGMIDDSHFGTGDAVFNKNVDSGTGLKLLIKPIEALTIGAFVPFTEGTDIDLAFGNMTIGASFKHQVVNVTAALELGSKTNAPSTSGTGTTDYSSIGVLFDVNTAPIPGLGLDISGYFFSGDFGVEDYFGKVAGTPAAYGDVYYNGFAIAPKVSYSTGPISAYGRVKVITYAVPDVVVDYLKAASLPALKDPGSDIDLEFQVKYAVGKFAPYLRFGIGVGDDDMDASGARVRVGTPINLSDGLSFEVFDEIGRIGAKDVSAVTTGSTPVAGKKGISNTFRAQIKYTF